MNRILKHIFVFAASVLMAGACVEKPDDGGKTIDPASFRIIDAPEVAEFRYGQTLAFDVEYSGVEKFEFRTPEGWTSAVGDDSLFVTAPEKSSGVETEGKIVVYYTGADGKRDDVKLPVAIVDDSFQDVTFELRYTDVTSTTATLEVIPSDETVPYYYDVCTMEDFNRVGGDVSLIVREYMEYVLETYPSFTVEDVLTAMLTVGPDSDTVYGLPSGVEMCFYAVAIDEEGNAASEPAVVSFKTLEGGDPADCTFELEVSEIRGTTAFISIVPSDPSVRYWYAVVSREEYPGDIPLMVDVKTTAESYAAEIGRSLEEVIASVTVKGAVAEYWYDLEVDKEYYLYAFAMDEQGDYAGPMFKKPFKTASSDISDAEVAIEYRYFDGDVLAAYDPERFPNAAGRVLVQVSATPNAFAVDWAVALASGDLTDDITYPYESTVNAMLSSGVSKYNKTLQQFYANWSDCTILAFAADMSGVNGPLQRVLVSPVRENASPVEELAPVESSAVQSAVPMEHIRFTHAGDGDLSGAFCRRMTCGSVPSYRR